MLYGKVLLSGLILTRAVYTDMKTGTIENRLTGAGLAAGLLMNLMEGGGQGFWESLRASALMLASLFILFLLRGLGAGDIKLLAAVTAFFPRMAVRLAVASFLAGAVLAAGKMLYRRLRKGRLYVRGETVHFSVAIAAGTLFACMGEVL